MPAGPKINALSASIFVPPLTLSIFFSLYRSPVYADIQWFESLPSPLVESNLSILLDRLHTNVCIAIINHVHRVARLALVFIGMARSSQENEKW